MKKNPLIFFTRINANKSRLNSRQFVKKKFVGRAFTLVEVLLAVFILEIGLLGIAGFYASSFRIIKTARNETTASNLANGLLDEELAISYDNLLPLPGSKVRYSDLDSNPFYDWWKQIDVAYIDANLAEQTSETNMKKITITVFWQEAGSERSFQTASIKAKH